MTPKEPILISAGNNIVRIRYGHAKAYIHPSVEIIEPSRFEEFGGFYPAQSVEIQNFEALSKMRDALTVVIDEYDAARKKEDEEK